MTDHQTILISYRTERFLQSSYTRISICGRTIRVLRNIWKMFWYKNDPISCWYVLGQVIKHVCGMNRLHPQSQEACRSLSLPALNLSSQTLLHCRRRRKMTTIKQGAFSRSINDAERNSVPQTPKSNMFYLYTCVVRKVMDSQFTITWCFCS